MKITYWETFFPSWIWRGARSRCTAKHKYDFIILIDITTHKILPEGEGITVR